MVTGAQRSLKRESPLASCDLRGGASRGMRRGKKRTRSARRRHPVKREYEEGGGRE